MKLSLAAGLLLVGLALCFLTPVVGGSEDAPVCTLQDCADVSEVSLWLREARPTDHKSLSAKFTAQGVDTMERLQTIQGDASLMQSLMEDLNDKSLATEIKALFKTGFFSSVTKSQKFVVARAALLAAQPERTQASASAVKDEEVSAQVPVPEAAAEAEVTAETEVAAEAEAVPVVLDEKAAGPAIFDAAWIGDVAALELLIKQWKSHDVINWPNPTEHLRTPLMRACIYGQQRSVEMLLQAPSIAINQVDDIGMSALMHSAFNGRVDAIRSLVAAGADSKLSATGGLCKGQNALDIARFMKSKEAADTLIELGVTTDFT